MIIEPSFINKNLTIKLQVKMPIILSVKAPMTLARLENESSYLQNLTQHNGHQQSMTEYSHEAVPCGHLYVPILIRTFYFQIQCRMQVVYDN